MKKAVVGGIVGLGTAGLVGYALTLPPSTPFMASPQGTSDRQASAGQTSDPANTLVPAQQSNQQSPQPSAAPLFSMFSNPNEGWVLDQSSQMLGKQTAIMSGAGCKVNNQELDITYVVTNPDFRVAVYSDSRKICYLTTMDGMLAGRRKQKAAMESIGQISGAKDTPYVKAATGTIAGLNATQYVSQSAHDNFDRIVDGLDGTKSKPTVTEMWFTNDINVPAQFSRLSANPKNSNGLPSQGVLLRMASTTGDGVKMVTLDTVAARKVQINPNVFQFPAGYKAASSEMEVAYGDGAAGLNQLFSQMAQPDTKQDLTDIMKENADIGPRLNKSKQQWENAREQAR